MPTTYSSTHTGEQLDYAVDKSIDGHNGKLLDLIKTFPAKGIKSARLYTLSDGGSANISDKPTGSVQAGFTCDVICNRLISTSDYRYVLACYVQSSYSPYMAVITQATTAISWTQAKLTDTDTKNTAGTTDTSSKIYLVGATSQAANPQTYSDNEVYTTSGVLTTKSVQVGGGSATIQYNSSSGVLEIIC